MKPARILVVDDEYGIRRAVERVLMPAHQVVAAGSPSEALEKAAGFRPEVVILDIRMPEMDGFEVMARLKTLDPGVDVILMTGSVTEPDQKLVRALREKAFYFIEKPFDSDVLLTLVDRCLEIRRLAQENREHTLRLERELQQARAVQQSLLPPREAVVEGVAVACRYEPCHELGGDFCDYAPAGKGRVALLLADVSGHGAQAAMMTGVLKSAFHAAAGDSFDPRSVVARVAAALDPFGPERFVTLFSARIDTIRAGLEFVNAGHPAAILCRGRDVEPGQSRPRELLEATGPIVSPVFRDTRWEKGVVPLKEGDRLLIYSDGILEAPVGEDFFGENRIVSLAAGHYDDGTALVDRILGEVREATGGRPQLDDWTLISARPGG